MKNCFKEIYGKPIFKWRKEYRLDYASRLIEEGQLNISEISKKVAIPHHQNSARHLRNISAAPLQSIENSNCLFGIVLSFQFK